MTEYIVKFVSEAGDTVHSVNVKARNKQDACQKIEKDEKVKKALQKILGEKGGELDFYIYDTKNLN